MSLHSCEISPDGCIFWLSDGLAAALGYPTDGLLGMKETDLLHPEDVPLLTSLESCQLDSFELSYRKRHADKGYLRLSARRVRLREGERWLALEQVASATASSPRAPLTPGSRNARSRQYLSALSSSEDAQPEKQAAAFEYTFRTAALHDMTQKLSRLRKFAQLCTDVLLVCSPSAPPKLLLSPLCLEILGYGRAASPRALRPSPLARRPTLSARSRLVPRAAPAPQACSTDSRACCAPPCCSSRSA